MEYALVGWPDEGPQLRLDHREFSYAGKFVMSNTGKAVARDEGGDRKSEGDDGNQKSEGDDGDRKSEGDDGDQKLEGDDSDRVSEAEGNSHGKSNVEGNSDEYDESLVAAVAFNEDRTDPATAWLRYVTVRKRRRGEGVGARLARFAADRLRERGYDRVKIAVNNPFAYQALYKAGFGFTGEETGLAELVLARPGDRSPERYRAGLDAYRERDDLAPEEREFLDAKADADPPDAVAVPE